MASSAAPRRSSVHKVVLRLPRRNLDRAARSAFLETTNSTDPASDVATVQDPSSGPLRQISLLCCLVAILLPLSLALYDVVIVPLLALIDKIRNGGGDSNKQTAFQVICACVLAPLSVLASFGGFKGGMEKAMGTVKEIADAMEGDATFDRVTNVQEMDKDGDGLLDFEEFKKALRAAGGRQMTEAEMKVKWDALDVDGTGKVSAKEFENAKAAWNDGYLDFDEFCRMMRAEDEAITTEDLRARFDALNLDETGLVTQEEFAIANRAWKDNKLTFGEFVHMMQGDSKATAEELQDFKRKFNALDGNGNGCIGKKEFYIARATWQDGTLDFEEYCKLIRADEETSGLTDGELRQHFNTLDVNQNGKVSVEEFLAQTMRSMTSRRYHHRSK